jgi:hypothetical protein
VYSISFAHSLTFHEHGFYTEHQYEYKDVEDTSHSHSDELSINNEHINHNNHCDDGVFDLITCVLSDLTNHQHNDCEFEDESVEDSKRLTNSNSAQLLSGFTIFSIQFIDFNENEVSPFQLEVRVLTGLIDQNPLRGPPIYC